MTREGTEQETGRGSGPPEAGARDGKVDMVAKLTAWKKWDDLAPHEKSGDHNEGAEEPVEHEDVKGKKQKVTSTRTPSEIITFDPDADILWPGEIVSAKALIDHGGLEMVGVRAEYRAPLKLAIDALSAGDIKTVEEPDGATVLAAIRAAVNGKPNQSPDIVFRQTSAYSSAELCLELGLSAKYGNFSANLESTFSRKEGMNSLALYLRERAFTVTAVWDDANSLFNDSFTEEALTELQDYGLLGPEKPPLLISSVIYGRVLMAFLTSRTSETELNAAVEASYKGFAGLDTTVKERYKSVLSESEISVESHGGDPSTVGQLLTDGKIAEYFTKEKQLQEYSIIGYTLKQLHPHKLATMSEKTTYDRVRWHFPMPGSYDARLMVKRLSYQDQIFIWHNVDNFDCTLDGEHFSVEYGEDMTKWASSERTFSAQGQGEPFLLTITTPGWEGSSTELTPSKEGWFPGGDTSYSGWVKNRRNTNNHWLPYYWSVEVYADKHESSQEPHTSRRHPPAGNGEESQ
ncbi:thiol-activated cytolysin family protein [Streptomyces sp. NPDC045470]|uniref:thiol-activated cytolysin family protein n=1 Tax=Streptomyces sp. NPDC045470 TaxID=3155469 RepID=UPI0033C98065